MDDFENDEEYDENDEQQLYDEDDDESLKEKYDRGKEKYDKYKEKYDKYKNKKNGNDPSKNAEDAKKFRDNLRSSNRAGTETAKQGGKEAAKQGGKEAAKQGGKEAGKQVAKQAGKEAAKTGAKVAAEGAAASTGVGILVAVGIELADRLNKLRKQIENKVNDKIKEDTGVDVKKTKKWALPAIIFAIIFLLFVFPAMAMFGLSDTATSDLKTLVRAREEQYDKKLIMFTKAEMKELLKKNIEVDDDVATKLSEEGLTLEKKDNGKYQSISYKSILKSYGKDLTSTFVGDKPLDGIDTSEIADDDGTETDLEKDEAVSLKNVQKYLMAEIDNFNNGVKWNKTSLNVSYVNNKSQSFSDYDSYKNNSEKVTPESDGILNRSEIADKNYTIKDDNDKDTMLKMPKLSDHGVDVSSGENNVAKTYVDMLEPYMQKWVIPYCIMIDTQDENFVDGVIKEVYHPATVDLFQLKQLTKTIEYEYYLECSSYRYTRYVRKTFKVSDVNEKVSSQNYEYEASNNDLVLYREGLNTKDNKLGEYIISDTFVQEAEGGGYVYKQTIEEIRLTPTPTIANDANGDPLVKKINVSRKIDNYSTIPELTNVGSFYEILDREYTINPINENNTFDEAQDGELIVDSDSGTAKQESKEIWYEHLNPIKSEVNKYTVSYYTEEQMENLGRPISRIEWYQDWIGVSHSGSYEGMPGEGGSGPVSANESQRNFIEKVAQYAIEDAKVTGIYPSVTIAQSIIESGWGRDNIATRYGNHFGMKAFSRTGNEFWNGDQVNLNASEGGKNYFRVYNTTTGGTYDDPLYYSVRDHGRNFWVTATYGSHGVLECMSKNLGPKEQLRRVAISGYAVMRDGSITKPDGVRTYDKYLYDEFIVKYDLEKYDKDENGNNWWDGAIPAFARTSNITGDAVEGGGGGLGETLYSYEDMYFAYYQIEQWYEQGGINILGQNFETIVLPEGGFGWPVSATDGTGTDKIYRMYGSVSNYSGTHDGIDISGGTTSWYDSDEKLTKGADVFATHPGTVYKVVPVSEESKYAYVEMKTEDGKFKTHYGCLSQINVAEGDTVTKGQVIGKIGKTGAHQDDTELYLHYKMYYKGSLVDPLLYYVIQDASGNEVLKYDELDKTTVTANSYKYKSSRLYVGGASYVEGGDVSQGYTGIYHSTSGKVYVEFKQYIGPWAPNTWISGSVARQGCWLTSCAIILSGYGFMDVTPEVARVEGRANGCIAITSLTKRMNAPQSNSGASAKTNIINHLKTGNAVKIYVRPPTRFTNNEHSMAILDIRSNGGKIEVYLSNPSGKDNWNPSGWYDIDTVLSGLVYYWLVSPK